MVSRNHKIAATVLHPGNKSAKVEYGEQMAKIGYVELHARSAFSFLRGASVPEEYAAACAAHQQHAMALLDLDGVYGSPRFHLAAQKAGIVAHIGAEVTCTDGGCYPLLARNRKGYQNLCRLITLTKLRVGKHQPSAATPEELAEYADGLICLTGDEHGPLARAFSNGNPAAALDRILATFGRENVYAEIQRHHLRDEEVRNQAVIELARRMRVPLVATNGPCHVTPAQRQLLDVFTCLYNKVTLAEAGCLLARNSERHVKSSESMASLFADLPDAIANTLGISSRLNFTLSNLGYEFPPYPVPPGETMNSFLARRTDEGARRRYRPYHDRARRQIERELALLAKLNLAGYFLIVWDIVNFCREEGILVQGRGSAANSAVCYSLGITAVDPVGMDLLFERFLSEERGEWPDIDLDLPSGDQRESVIQHVYRRYGQLGAAMTANVITYRGRMAAREAGKVMGFDVGTLNTLSKLVPGWGWHDESDKPAKQFREAGLDLANPRIRKFMELVVALQDLPRHLGQHSGGMVICQGRLDQVVPLEPASMPGRVVVQWDKEDCADLGIIKVDLLGLGMMAALEDCLRMIRDHWGEEIDMGRIPADDPLVYQPLQKADTIGLFQVESRAQQASLPRMKPERFYDLVVQVAIIRPGPIVGKMVHPYLNRRQGREPVDYLHPALQPVLERTLGVPLFQEQLLRMAMVVANFTGGEAEELRRAMGFKRSEQRMKAIEARLRAGMTANGITPDAQEAIVHSITAFALYGFPESHAASFALLAYASAYFKVHYLAAFTAALLNNQPMGFYSPAVLIKDAQRHGLRMLPIDVTVSDWNCTIELPAGIHQVRLGLRYVRGLRESSARALLEERARAPFLDIDDLARRVPALRSGEMTTLAEVGALNPLNAKHRRDALWKQGHAMRPAGPLLNEVPENAPESLASPLAPMSAEERLTADYHGTGVNLGRHPMAYRRREMTELGVTPASLLPRVPSGGGVRIAGCVITRQRPGTAKGILFLTMEDETGISNSVVMPDVFERYKMHILGHAFLLVEGVIQNVDGVIHVRASRLEPLDATMAAPPSHDFH
jgi:error-prone DNA polymerase